MGRIETQLVKRVTLELLEKYHDKFTPHFDDNKRVVSQCCTVSSKKMRNVIAGYASRLKKSKRYYG